jgi:hypothetical protein
MNKKRKVLEKKKKIFFFFTINMVLLSSGISLSVLEQKVEYSFNYLDI